MSFVTRLLKGFITPIKFTLKSGHFLSSLLGKSVDGNGNPIPMLTYPSIEIIELMDLAEVSILEWGTGQSSIYFSKRAKSVVGVESSGKWAKYVRNRTSKNTKIKLCSNKNDFNCFKNKLVNNTFDIVIVDGIPYPNGSREEAANATLSLKDSPKLIIVDNSEIEEYNQIIKKFKKEGYMNVDFVGYSPGAYYKQKTSFLFKKSEVNWLWGNIS